VSSSNNGNSALMDSPTTTTRNVVAVLSMLHESPLRNSATRCFRSRPVLRWTLERLGRARRVDSVVVLCWEDQLEDVFPIAEDMRADVLAKGPRCPIPELDAVSAARRWADGWRGGLLATCEFDRGFHAGYAEEIAGELDTASVLLVDPAAGLIDPALVDSLIVHANEHTSPEICFMPAAPGLTGTLLRRPLLKRLAAARAHAGPLLHYAPDVVSREPLAGESCAPAPTSVVRSTDRFTLDSDRQIERIAAATFALNGQLIASSADNIVARMRDLERLDSTPREVVIELNTARASSPIYWPGRHHKIDRPQMTLHRVQRMFDELAASADDARVTIAGVGDPLLTRDLLFRVIERARQAEIGVHVETDLLDGDVTALAASEVDVVSVHVPAMTPPTYAAVMGADRYAGVLENIRTFVAERARRGRGLPILVPTFTKCRDNLGEMEAWYDQWLRAVGSAIITGPSDFSGQIPVVAVADMAPPRRRPCNRLWSRMVVHSDGNVVACEQDFAGRKVLGNVDEMTLQEVWKARLAPLRADHRSGDVAAAHPLCGGCREWHRP
jgi:radical SAM protein with 4Fe4S-binding SPASM domain